MQTTQQPLKLKVMLGDYPNTVALTQGTLRSDCLALQFAEALEQLFDDVTRTLD